MEKKVKYVPTVTATEYAESVGKGLKEYVLDGVSGHYVWQIIKTGQERDAEAIVNVKERILGTRNSAGVADTYLDGTALIPKDRKRKKQLPSTLKKRDIKNVR